MLTPTRARIHYGTIVVALGLVIFLFVVHALSSVLAPLGIAFIVSYLLDPLVDRLERARIPRAASALGLLGLTGAAFVVLLRYGVPALAEEIAALAEGLPDRLAAAQIEVTKWLWDTAHVKVAKTPAELSKNYASELPSVAWAAVGAAWTTLGYVRVLVGLAIVPLFTVYLLIDFDRIGRRIHALIPRRWEQNVMQVSAEIHATLGGWIRGQATAGLVLSVLYSAGLKFIGLPLAIPIGVLTGLLAFVPYVGFGIGCCLALLVGLLQWSSATLLVHILMVMLGVQLLDALVVTPRVVGSSVGLGALEVLLAIMAAGALFGFLGVLFAVPLGAIFKILAQHAVRAYLRSDLYRRAPNSTVITPL